MTTYCAPTDLLTGDMTVSNNMLTQFTTLGTEEIDAVLSQVFVLPLAAIPPAVELSAYAKLNLKMANRAIASGRLIMDRAALAEDNALHAYGKSLYDEGMLMVMAMKGGTIDLGAVKLAAFTSEGDGPSVTNYDATSGVDAYYEFVSGGGSWDAETSLSWKPGPA